MFNKNKLPILSMPPVNGTRAGQLFKKTSSTKGAARAMLGALTAREEKILESKTQAHMLAHYIYRSRIAVAMNSPLVIFLAITFYGLVPHFNVLAWAISVLACDAIIFVGTNRYYKDKNKSLSNKPIFYKVGMIQNLGALFMAASLFVLAEFNQISPNANYLLFTCLALVAAFSCNVLTTSLQLFIPFVFTICAGLFIYFLMHYQAYYLWAVGTVSLAAASLLSGYVSHYQLKSYFKINALNSMMADKLVEQNQQLHELATQDTLTKIPNRRWIDEQIKRHIAEAIRYKQDLCVMLIDIDYFKSVNDTHGHAVGDEVLIDAANLLSTWLRNTDILGRYGGEEFVALLPMTNLEQAAKLADRLRVQYEKQSIYAAKYGKTLTFSVGIAQLERAQDSISDDDLNAAKKQFLNLADQALYMAKGNGRNRVELYIP